MTIEFRKLNFPIWTKINWCMPITLTADRAVKEIADIYIKGDKDKGLRAHILPVIQSAAPRNR